MNYQISKSAGIPAYQQLYRLVRNDIVQKVYPYGSKLPSKRLVAEETGVSTVTVEHAYGLLCDEGYIEAKERSGYIVIFRTSDVYAASAPEHPFSPMPFAKSEPTEFSYALLSRTMRHVISEYGEGILASVPNEGSLQLRGALCRYLARCRGIHAEAGQVIIGSGSEYLYRLIVELFGRERIYGIESPSYKQIRQVYSASEVAVEMLPLGHQGIETAALQNTKADILHISPYRSYPSGVTATASKRHEYLSWASRGDRFIVEDDFESEFSVSAKPVETLFADTDRDNVIYMNTFSRTISPSLRVGYMILPKKLSLVFREKLGFYTCTVPTFEQLVLTELLESGEFERHINRVRRQKRKASSCT